MGADGKEVARGVTEASLKGVTPREEEPERETYKTRPIPETYLTSRMARKASWGMSTLPTRRIRFLPAFCFSRTFILRV